MYNEMTSRKILMHIRIWVFKCLQLSTWWWAFDIINKTAQKHHIQLLRFKDLTDLVQW